jgi:hypothetical protein
MVRLIDVRVITKRVLRGGVAASDGTWHWMSVHAAGTTSSARRLSARAEEPVAGIAQSGHDIAA